jgi:sec-independent protein translocase protein TatC
MQSFFHYVSETRLRFLYLNLACILSFLFSYFYRIELIYVVSKPFLIFHRNFIFLDLTEALYTMLYVSVLTSFISILPILIYHFWAFFAPSYYTFERKTILKFIFIFSIVFLLELILTYSFIFPKICEFLMSFEVKSIDSILLKGQLALWSVELAPRIGSYFQYTLYFFLLILGLFQVPFIFIVLYSKGMINPYHICRERKYIFLGCLLLTACISPPDVVSQVILTTFIYSVYEIVVIVGLFFEPNYFLDIKNNK